MIKNIKPILLTFLLLVPAVAFPQENSTTTESSSTGDGTAASSNETKPSSPKTQVNPPSSEAQQKNDEGSSAATEALKASKEEEKKAKEKAAQTEELVEKGGLIAGKFQISVSESYTHTQSNQLYIEGFGILPILIVGNIDVQNVRRDIFTTSLSASYKLTNRSQVSVSVPWQHVMADISTAAGINGRQVVGSNKETKAQSSSLGDISIGVSYRLLNEGLSMPALSTFISLKTRTGRDFFETPDPAAHAPAGTGFYALSVSLSASKSSAPAVIFGSVGYGYNFERRNIPYTPAGKPPVLIHSYQPGQNFNLSTGVSVSLNYQLSLSWSIALSSNLSSKVNGNVSANSATNSITFSMSGTWRFNDKRLVTVSFASGLTADAGGATIGVRVPWNF